MYQVKYRLCIADRPSREVSVDQKEVKSLQLQGQDWDKCISYDELDSSETRPAKRKYCSIRARKKKLILVTTAGQVFKLFT